MSSSSSVSTFTRGAGRIALTTEPTDETMVHGIDATLTPVALMAHSGDSIQPESSPHAVKMNIPAGENDCVKAAPVHAPTAPPLPYVLPELKPGTSRCSTTQEDSNSRPVPAMDSQLRFGFSREKRLTSHAIMAAMAIQTPVPSR